MPGQPHNPLDAAARQTLAAAREAKSPLFERVALFTMIGSAVTATALAAVQALHMIRREMRDEQREREKERRAGAAAPPPERPGHGEAATAAMDGDDRRWSRREEQPAPATHGRQR